MLDLSTLTKFKSDIEGNHVTAYPVIIVGADTNNPVYISTIKETLLDVEYDADGNEINRTALVFKDYNLKISNIKESVNLESHVIKISNISITLSNYEQNGERLSDSLTSSINTSINVFYKTQSCTTIQDCLSLYKGIIRRVEHDDSTLKISLEDLTDSTFHKDVPTANMGNRRNCFNKDYINRYIPMTYGEVSKAPVLPYLDSIGSQGNYYISIIPDDVEDVTESGRGLSIRGFGSGEENPELAVFPYNVSYDDYGELSSGNDKNNPLFIYKGDYFRVLRNYEKNFHQLSGQDDLFAKNQQYTIDASQNFLKIEKLYSSGFAQNPPASNELQAFKLYYPSQAEILKTETDGGDFGLNGESRVINIETSIINPDSAIDNADKTSNFIDLSDSFSEFNTAASIPGIETDATGEVSYTVTGFRPSNYSSQRHGIHYPAMTQGELSWGGSTNYLYYISAWLQSNAHWLNKSVKFVSMPTGNLILSMANIYFGKIENGFSSEEGANMLSSIPMRVLPQYCLNDSYKDAWCNASGIPTDLAVQYTPKLYQAEESSSTFDNLVRYYTYTSNEGKWQWWDRFNLGYQHDTGSTLLQPDSDHNNAEGYHEYFGGEPSQYLNPKMLQWRWLDYNAETGEQYSTGISRTYVTNRSILRGEYGTSPCYYPGTVVKIYLDSQHSANIHGISQIHVGQWIPETMGATYSYEEGDTVLWINLFRDSISEELGIPHLFEMDDFAVFTPTAMTSKQWGDEISGGNSKMALMTEYYADWNGNEINTWKGTNINWTSGMVSDTDYAGGYGHNYMGQGHDDTAKIHEKDLLSNAGGGEAWFLYIDDEIPADKVFTTMPDNDGEYTLATPSAGKGTIIPKGCLIPCNHMMNEAPGGMFWQPAVRNVQKGVATTFGDAANNVAIVSGTGTVAESRLGLLFPFSDIEVSDAMPGETKSYIYGKIEVNFPNDTGDPVIHNIDGGDTFLLQAYAAETRQSDELDYNAEFVGDTTFACNLMSIEGNDELFNTNMGIQVKDWTFGDTSTEYLPIGNAGEHILEAWDSPDKFDAISLVYRVISGDNNKSVQLSTNVYSIGILQFNQFENALNDDFYADVLGRANNSDDYILDENNVYRYKYGYNEISDENLLIENPADIIYHMIEKELNQDKSYSELELLNIVNRDSWIYARENSIVSKAGFSIKDKINSKKLIEDICKSTNLYPRFGNNGQFDFKVIKNTYTESDVNIEIKQKDIIKFSFTRTPIENVITMANVKYKKDYAKDEYRSQTGYCDSHDFFGNGDKGAEVLRYNGALSNSFEGYDYALLGLTREDNILEFESDYIRNHQEANSLRDFLLMQNCNQHTIIKCTLPLKYIHVEIGDIIKFDKLNNGTKAYGEDYTKNGISRNGQIIYPYFIITSAIKSSKDIKIECQQLHGLERTFTAGLGSLSRRSELGLYGDYQDVEEGDETTLILGTPVYFNFINGDFTLADLDIFINILAGYVSYLTSEQKINADITNDGNVNQWDINLLLSFFATENLDSDLMAGDINFDGNVNVVDIVTLVAFVLGYSDFNQEQWTAANVGGGPEDELVNVVDIVELVNIVMGD